MINFIRGQLPKNNFFVVEVFQPITAQNIRLIAKLLQAQADILEGEEILPGRCTHCDKGECLVHGLPPHIPASNVLR